MLTTLRRDRRTCRQAQFSLESLDDRLVLSAGAGGAAAEAVSAKAAAIEHRHEVRVAKHEAKLARIEARHDAKVAAKEQILLARAESSAAAKAPVSAVAINAAGSATGSGSATSAGSASATGSGSANSTYIAPGAPPASNGNTNPGANVPGAPVTTTPPVTGTPTPTPTSTGTGSTTSPGPLPANVAAALQSLYTEYENAGGGSSFTPSQPSDNLLQISGTSVMVNLTMASGGNFSTFLSQLQSDGLSVSTSSATYATVDGMLPIADLPAVATVAASVTPVNPPLQL